MFASPGDFAGAVLARSEPDTVRALSISVFLGPSLKSPSFLADEKTPAMDQIRR